MTLDKTCKTCEFNFDDECGMYNTHNDIGCDEWEASFKYHLELEEKAPWYIKEPYKKYKIRYGKFLELLQKDSEGIGIDVNIYDAIEKIYELNAEELAGVLGASIGVLSYARMDILAAP